MQFRLAAIVAAGALGLGVAACGGDDSTSADSTTTSVSTTTSADVSMEGYTKQIEDRCGQYQEERGTAEEALQGIGDPNSLSEDELKAIAPDIVALDDTTRSMIADAEAFPRPADNAAELETIYGYLDDTVASLNDADAAAEAGDVDALIAAFKQVDAGLQSADEANSANYGFNTCS